MEQSLYNTRSKAILHNHLLSANVGQQAVDVLIRHNIQPVVHPFKGTEEQIWTGIICF